MKLLRFLAVYLFAGALACVVSGFAIGLFLTGYNRDYDLSPLYGIFIGGPVWLIAYPVSFAVLMGKTGNFTRS